MKHDPVNNPVHYDLFPNQQSIDLIEKCLTPEEFEGFLKGNCLKYRIRAGKKDGQLQQDIDKADWYQHKLWARPEPDEERWVNPLTGKDPTSVQEGERRNIDYEKNQV
jgi:hypothetical protein